MQINVFKPRKAMFSIDMAVAAVILIAMVATAFYYATYLYTPKQPFREVLKNEGGAIAKSLSENVSWTVYRLPLIVTSQSLDAKYWVLGAAFRPDDAIDLNSIAVLDRNFEELPSAFSDSESELFFSGNISAGKNRFYLVYSKNTSLPKLEYGRGGGAGGAGNANLTNLNSSNTWANNSLINVKFSSSGISNIIFGGSEMLDSGGADLGTSGTPQNVSLPIRAKISYSNGVSATVYPNSSKIIIHSESGFNPVLYIPESFATYYNGSEHGISGSNLQFNAILNLTDIASQSSPSKGVAVIGNNLNVSIYNSSSYNEIRLYNVTDFEIYSHEGNYASAVSEKDKYLSNHLSPPSVLTAAPSEIKGVSISNLESLAALPYSAVRDAFAKTGNFNLSVENASASVGARIPSDRNVMVVSYPAAILGRFGNVTKTQLSVAVWLGGDYA